MSFSNYYSMNVPNDSTYGRYYHSNEPSYYGFDQTYPQAQFSQAYHPPRGQGYNWFDESSLNDFFLRENDRYECEQRQKVRYRYRKRRFNKETRKVNSNCTPPKQRRVDTTKGKPHVTSKASSLLEVKTIDNLSAANGKTEDIDKDREEGVSVKEESQTLAIFTSVKNKYKEEENLKTYGEEIINVLKEQVILKSENKEIINVVPDSKEQQEIKPDQQEETKQIRIKSIENTILKTEGKELFNHVSESNIQDKQEDQNIHEKHVGATVLKIELEQILNTLYEVVTLRTEEGDLVTWKTPIMHKAAKNTEKNTPQQLATVIIGNISRSTNVDWLKELAKQVGDISSISHDQHLGRAKLVFQRSEDAYQFYLKFHKKKFTCSKESLSVMVV